MLGIIPVCVSDSLDAETQCSVIVETEKVSRLLLCEEASLTPHLSGSTLKD